MDYTYESRNRSEKFWKRIYENILFWSLNKKFTIFIIDIINGCYFEHIKVHPKLRNYQTLSVLKREISRKTLSKLNFLIANSIST